MFRNLFPNKRRFLILVLILTAALAVMVGLWVQNTKRAPSADPDPPQGFSCEANGDSQTSPGSALANASCNVPVPAWSYPPCQIPAGGLNCKLNVPGGYIEYTFDRSAAGPAYAVWFPTDGKSKPPAPHSSYFGPYCTNEGNVGQSNCHSTREQSVGNAIYKIEANCRLGGGPAAYGYDCDLVATFLRAEPTSRGVLDVVLKDSTTGEIKPESVNCGISDSIKKTMETVTVKQHGQDVKQPIRERCIYPERWINKSISTLSAVPIDYTGVRPELYSVTIPKGKEPIEDPNTQQKVVEVEWEFKAAPSPSPSPTPGTVLNGRVVTYRAKEKKFEKVTGAQVCLLKTSRKEDCKANDQTKAKRTTTDADGVYSFTLTRDELGKEAALRLLPGQPLQTERYFTDTSVQKPPSQPPGTDGWTMTEKSQAKTSLAPKTVHLWVTERIVMVGAGDIAEFDPDDLGPAVATGKLAEQILKEAEENDAKDCVFTLGDNAYHSGTYKQFQNKFRRVWGFIEQAEYRDCILPNLGNHEVYAKGGAKTAKKRFFGFIGVRILKTNPQWGSGYERYFRELGVNVGEKGKYYYSRVVGNWRVIALNSNCDFVGGCSENQPQGRWLRQQLEEASAAGQCTIITTHHPRFSSGVDSGEQRRAEKKYPDIVVPQPHGSNTRLDNYWRLANEYGADLWLAAHWHGYNRLAPMGVEGDGNFNGDPAYVHKVDPNGPVQFIVGTGGGEFSANGQPLPTSRKIIQRTPGLLELTLQSDSYYFRFRNTNNEVLDEPEDRQPIACHRTQTRLPQENLNFRIFSKGELPGAGPLQGATGTQINLEWTPLSSGQHTITLERGGKKRTLDVSGAEMMIVSPLESGQYRFTLSDKSSIGEAKSILEASISGR